MTIEASITKRLGKNFTLEVDLRTDGGCLGILGASGSGKSMTLKCIAGIETPDRGCIMVNGRTLFDSERKIDVRPQERRVGYLFQNYALFPRMTIAQNIGIGVPGSARDRSRVVSGFIERFHLEGQEARFPDQLSGGQQQRAALARMLAADPEIILLDEPFSALDTHLREQMQIRLLEILKSRGDVIMVTHSRDEAYKLCSDLLVLDSGRVLGGGKTRSLFDNPEKLSIARLTGCKNFSRIERVSGGLRALDWGLTLIVNRSIPADADCIGIRAHDLTPVYEMSSGLDNLVEMRVLERSEDPFEWCVVFANAAATEPSQRGEIWWKFSKYLFDELPRHLRIPPEALLFLKDDESGNDS